MGGYMLLIVSFVFAMAGWDKARWWLLGLFALNLAVTIWNRLGGWEWQMAALPMGMWAMNALFVWAVIAFNRWQDRRRARKEALTSRNS